jgi:hypothetical protein
MKMLCRAELSQLTEMCLKLIFVPFLFLIHSPFHIHYFFYICLLQFNLSLQNLAFGQQWQ